MDLGEKGSTPMNALRWICSSSLGTARVTLVHQSRTRPHRLCCRREEELSGTEVGSGTEAQLPSALDMVEFSSLKTKPGLVSPESQKARPAQLSYVVRPSLIAELLRRIAGARHR